VGYGGSKTDKIDIKQKRACSKDSILDGQVRESLSGQGASEMLLKVARSVWCFRESLDLGIALFYPLTPNPATSFCT
jgi:hypothetical protein